MYDNIGDSGTKQKSLLTFNFQELNVLSYKKEKIEKGGSMTNEEEK